MRNRPRDGAPGFEVLAPLLLDDGTVFVVDRGWLPTGSAQDAPDAVPAPPDGEVDRGGAPQARRADAARAHRSGGPARDHPSAESVAELVGEPTYTGAYGLLATEDPGGRATCPPPAVKPDADEGPHLSYALQWIAFGILAFVGLFWAFRRERRFAALPAEEQAAAARQRPRRPSPQRRHRRRGRPARRRRPALARGIYASEIRSA